MAGSIPTIIRTYKASITRRFGRCIWQRNYYEHVIRDEADWARIRLYIETNPSRWSEDEAYACPNRFKPS